MKILLTGGAGFIGSHVAEEYLRGGHRIVVVDNLSSGKREYIPPEADFYPVDIRDRKALEAVFSAEKPDVVNHHAAQISVSYSVKEPKFDAEVNILGSLNLIDLSARYGVKRFVYASSGGAVYGEPIKNPCDEKHPVNPLSPYGISKHVVEHYLYFYGKNYGFDYVILRYPNVYGPRQDPYGEAGVIAIFSLRMLRREEVTINGDGNQERDFVYVKDIARANSLALSLKTVSCDDPLGPIFNLGSGVGTSVNEIFKKLSEITEYAMDPIYGPPKPGEVYKIALDASKAKDVLGWEPEMSFERGLRETVEWFKKEATY